jgi:hypothetical protein
MGFSHGMFTHGSPNFGLFTGYCFGCVHCTTYTRPVHNFYVHKGATRRRWSPLGNKDNDLGTVSFGLLTTWLNGRMDF